MGMHDLISDMLARINTASMRRRLVISVIRSKHCISVLQCLYEAGFLRGYVIKNNEVEVFLKYTTDSPVIRKISRISRPGFRKYATYNELMERYAIDKEIIVYSSPKGVRINNMIYFDKEKLGGEMLLSIR